MPQRIKRRYPGRRSTISALIFFIFCCFIVNSFTQNTNETLKDERRRANKPQLESRSPQEPSAPRPKGYTFGVNVDVILMYTSVFDKNGHFVSGLAKDSFKIYEDGIEQKITSFAQEDVPVSMGILLDLSGSMRGNRSGKQSRSRLYSGKQPSGSGVFGWIQ